MTKDTFGQSVTVLFARMGREHLLQVVWDFRRVCPRTDALGARVLYLFAKLRMLGERVDHLARRLWGFGEIAAAAADRGGAAHFTRGKILGDDQTLPRRRAVAGRQRREQGHRDRCHFSPGAAFFGRRWVLLSKSNGADGSRLAARAHAGKRAI